MVLVSEAPGQKGEDGELAICGDGLRSRMLAARGRSSKPGDIKTNRQAWNIVSAREFRDLIGYVKRQGFAMCLISSTGGGVEVWMLRAGRA